MQFIKNLKKKQKEIAELGKKLRFRKIDDNIFPYSCLVDDDVLLTKNGEVVQIIKILLDDFKLNQDGGLRDAIRTAISENTNDLKTAFWIQTVKRKKAKIKKTGKVIKHEFLNR